MSSGLIIFVDDDALFRKLYSDFLTVHGYTVMTANSGAKGMNLLLNCMPKVLILDISMPGIDGIETCRRIRRIHGGETPIIFLTSYNEIDKLRECMHAGGDDYMIKSDSLDSILERIKFWSAAPNRKESRERRLEVMQEIDNAIVRIDQATKLLNSTDKKNESMSRLMATAQSLADKANLTGRSNKFYIYGYAAGIVSHWADTQLGVKARYMDYFRAALSGSDLLTPEDIEEVMNNFQPISKERLFLKGRKRARAACQITRESQGDVMVTDGDAAKFAAIGPL